MSIFLSPESGTAHLSAKQAIAALRRRRARPNTAKVSAGNLKSEGPHAVIESSDRLWCRLEELSSGESGCDVISEGGLALCVETLRAHDRHAVLRGNTCTECLSAVTVMARSLQSWSASKGAHGDECRSPMETLDTTAVETLLELRVSDCIQSASAATAVLKSMFRAHARRVAHQTQHVAVLEQNARAQSKRISELVQRVLYLESRPNHGLVSESNPLQPLHQEHTIEVLSVADRISKFSASSIASETTRDQELICGTTTGDADHGGVDASDELGDIVTPKPSTEEVESKWTGPFRGTSSVACTPLGLHTLGEEASILLEELRRDAASLQMSPSEGDGVDGVNKDHDKMQNTETSFSNGKQPTSETEPLCDIVGVDDHGDVLSPVVPLSRSMANGSPDSVDDTQARRQEQDSKGDSLSDDMGSCVSQRDGRASALSAAATVSASNSPPPLHGDFVCKHCGSSKTSTTTSQSTAKNQAPICLEANVEAIAGEDRGELCARVAEAVDLANSAIASMEAAHNRATDAQEKAAAQAQRARALEVKLHELESRVKSSEGRVQRSEDEANQQRTMASRVVDRVTKEAEEKESQLRYVEGQLQHAMTMHAQASDACDLAVAHCRGVVLRLVTSVGAAARKVYANATPCKCAECQQDAASIADGAFVASCSDSLCGQCDDCGTDICRRGPSMDLDAVENIDSLPLDDIVSRVDKSLSTFMTRLTQERLRNRVELYHLRRRCPRIELAWARTAAQLHKTEEELRVATMVNSSMSFTHDSSYAHSEVTGLDARRGGRYSVA